MNSVAPVVSALGKLDCVSNARVVGSYAAGEKSPKDVDLLLKLNIDEVELMRSKRGLKGKITGILRKTSIPSLFDIFLVTQDGASWRLRPWVDIDSGKLSWDWE